MVMRDENLPYIYGAVDRKKLELSLVGSARPLDMAFRLCALGVEDWARYQHPQDQFGVINIDFKDQYLLILDDHPKNPEIKKQLYASYRSLRAAHPWSRHTENRLWHAHDDMYFGDSRYSVGIQMADLCNYFMMLHLRNDDEGGEFYEMFAGQAIAAKPEPYWSQFRDFVVSHDSRDQESVIELKDDANAKGKAAQ